MSSESTDMAQINNLTKQIDTIKAELSEKLELAKKVKQSNMYDNFKFWIIAGVCIFFVWVILDSTIKTFTLYFKNRKREKEHKKKQSAPDDNEFEAEYSMNAKVEQKMRMNLQRAGENQNKELHLAKKEKLISSNKELSDREIRNMPLEGNIDIQSLNKEHDEYQYDETKKGGSSFWDMVFQSKDI
jgi:hypothetical protein